MEDRKKNSVRSLLGKAWRRTWRTNDAYWFCRRLPEQAFALSAGEAPDAARLEWEDFETSIAWIRDQSQRFGWVYNAREAEVGKNYRHFYPLLSYGGKAVGYIKIAFQMAFVEDYEDCLPLSSDEAFICDTFILPELRGKGLARLMLEQTLARLGERGVKFVFCHIPGWNTASIRLYQGLGFSRIGHVRYLRLLGFRLFSHHPLQTKERGRSLAIASAG